MLSFVAASPYSPCPYKDEMVYRCQACSTESECGLTPIVLLLGIARRCTPCHPLMYNTSPMFAPRGLTRNAMYKRASHTHSRNARGASGPAHWNWISIWIWILTARYASGATCSILHWRWCSPMIHRYASCTSRTSTKRAVVY